MISSTLVASPFTHTEMTITSQEPRPIPEAIKSTHLLELSGPSGTESSPRANETHRASKTEPSSVYHTQPSIRLKREDRATLYAGTEETR